MSNQSKKTEQEGAVLPQNDIAQPAEQAAAAEEATRAPKPRKRAAKEGAQATAKRPRKRSAKAQGAEEDGTTPAEAGAQAPDTATGKKSRKTQENAQGAQDTAQTEATPLPEALQLAAPQPNLPVVAEPNGVQVAVPPIVFPALKKERRSFFGRLLLLAVVGAVLAFSLFIFLYRPTLYSTPNHSIRFLYDGTQTYVLYDGELCEGSYPGTCTQSVCDSTGSICAAMIGDTLYLIQGDEVTPIISNVADFQLSQNGDALVYRTQEEKLFYLEIGGDLSTSLVRNRVKDACYALSPDGEILFYTYMEEGKNNNEIIRHATFFSLSGNWPLLQPGTDILPVAVSDDYEHIFYYNEARTTLYYRNAEGEISICHTDENAAMSLLFDREFEEVLIEDARGVTLWQDGTVTVVPQLKGTETLIFLPNHRAAARKSPLAEQYLVSTFDQNYFLKKSRNAEDGREEVRLVYLDGDTLTANGAAIDEARGKPIVTDKGVYYLELVSMQDADYKHLFRCAWGETVGERLCWDMDDFWINSDGSRLLYTDSSGALYAADVSGSALDARRISDADYEEGKTISCLVTAADAFYYKVNGKVYVSDNGGDPEQVEQNAALLFSDAHTAFYFVEDGTLPDGTKTYTVYTNYRNRSEAEQVATGVIGMDAFMDYIS